MAVFVLHPSYALCWFVHPHSLRPICVDVWETMGPNRGVYRERFGGLSIRTA